MIKFCLCKLLSKNLSEDPPKPPKSFEFCSLTIEVIQ